MQCTVVMFDTVSHAPYISKSVIYVRLSLSFFPLRGFAKKKIQKIRDYYGSGWVGPGLTRNFFLENRPKIALNQC